MKNVTLSPDLKLPVDVVTETIAILAKRGAGKTYTASVLAEELLAAELPVVIADPTGAWWGLRASADGKSEGYPITILGGDHGDVPLEPTAGKVVAELVAAEAPPLVLDLSRLSKGESIRFMTDFAERLYLKNRNPLHLILDEADSFAPQKPRPEGARLLGAIDDIVRRGRIRGLGVTLVTQRSAVLNKDVLTQAEVLVVLRTPHPKDRAPVLEWMRVHATPEQLAEVEASLAGLEVGEAWVMSAGWLDLFRRVRIRKRETFNSSATPKAGERRIVPRRLAPVDLEALQARFAETVERAKAEDPRHLRARVAELERQLGEAQRAKPAAAPARERVVERPVVPPAVLARAEALLARAEKVATGLVSEAGRIQERLERAGLHAPTPDTVASVAAKARAAAAAVEAFHRHVAPGPSTSARTAAEPSTPSRVASRGRNGSAGPELPAGELAPSTRRVLEAAASLPGGRASRRQLATLAGYRPKGGRFGNILGELRSRGLLEGRGDDLAVTAAGFAAVDQELLRPKSGAELRQLWREKLAPSEWRVLEAAIAAYPRTITRAELAASVDPPYDPRGGRFGNILGLLRSAGLLEGRGDALRATELVAS